ncbi:MAG: hypothetical protein AB7R69_00585 [Candidatus Babeliales bacterium]
MKKLLLFLSITSLYAAEMPDISGLQQELNTLNNELGNLSQKLQVTQQSRFAPPPIIQPAPTGGSEKPAPSGQPGPQRGGQQQAMPVIYNDESYFNQKFPELAQQVGLQNYTGYNITNIANVPNSDKAIILINAQNNYAVGSALTKQVVAEITKKIKYPIAIGISNQSFDPAWLSDRIKEGKVLIVDTNNFSQDNKNEISYYVHKPLVSTGSIPVYFSFLGEYEAMKILKQLVPGIEKNLGNFVEIESGTKAPAVNFTQAQKGIYIGKIRTRGADHALHTNTPSRLNNFINAYQTPIAIVIYAGAGEFNVELGNIKDIAKKILEEGLKAKGILSITQNFENFHGFAFELDKGNVVTSPSYAKTRIEELKKLLGN